MTLTARQRKNLRQHYKNVSRDELIVRLDGFKDLAHIRGKDFIAALQARDTALERVRTANNEIERLTDNWNMANADAGLERALKNEALKRVELLLKVIDILVNKS